MRLRSAEDVRAEEFHVAAIAESEEVAGQQARALTRASRDLTEARRDLTQAHQDHERAIGEVRARAETKQKALETQRDDAQAEAERQRSEAAERDARIALLSDEAAQRAQAIEAVNNRTAVEEARVLAYKVRHGIWWRIRRLKRRR